MGMDQKPRVEFKGSLQSQRGDFCLQMWCFRTNFGSCISLYQTESVLPHASMKFPQLPSPQKMGSKVWLCWKIQVGLLCCFLRFLVWAPVWIKMIMPWKDYRHIISTLQVWLSCSVPQPIPLKKKDRTKARGSYGAWHHMENICLHVFQDDKEGPWRKHWDSDLELSTGSRFQSEMFCQLVKSSLAFWTETRVRVFLQEYIQKLCSKYIVSSASAKYKVSANMLL